MLQELEARWAAVGFAEENAIRRSGARADALSKGCDELESRRLAAR